MKKTSDLDRRGFLKASVLGCVGAAAVRGAIAGEEPDPDLDFEMEEPGAPEIRRFNVLGKTGLKVSDISLGMAREPSVLRYALDRGINFFDTAEGYYDGQHEIALGRALGKRRDEIVVTTKHYIGAPGSVTKKELKDRFDESLKRLGFEYVDIAMMHQVGDAGLFEDEAVLGAYEELKKAGKYRFLGFSTHDAENICPPAYESGLFSAMMVYYNSVQYPERTELVREAAKRGIGVIAMKTMAGREQDNVAEMAEERTTYAQAAIKWALEDPAVSSAVVTMRTFEHIDEYLQASGHRLTGKENASLDRYRKLAGNRYCRMGCSECVSACPAGVAIPDVLRFGMYFENYGIEKHAMLEYARLEEGKRAAACRTCDGRCEAACPHGLSICDRLGRYDGLLRV
jgi:predicted aldo/keto reductase-like oxidoreductase